MHSATTTTTTIRPALRRQHSKNRPTARSPWDPDVSPHCNGASRPFQFLPRRRVISDVKEFAPVQLRDESNLPLQEIFSCHESTPWELVHASRPVGSLLEVNTPKVDPIRPPHLSPVVASDASSLDGAATETSDHRLSVSFPRTAPNTGSTLSDTHATFPRSRTDIAHAFAPTPVSPALHLIRKKSGEVLKPSLRARTKSAPSSPGKAVHFDHKLEHVRLFRARQMPRAVSRDGSPTETSDGETSDGPVYAPTLRTLNGGAIVPPPPDGPWTFDVRLEHLALDAPRASLLGTVLVRNITYTKAVAARFTFDAWQTISEVAARHIAPARCGAFDRFEFRIRLPRRGRLLLCVRYAAAGQEMWDNNSGRNYTFEFDCAPRQKDAVAVDLRTRLEHVVRARIVPAEDTDEEEDGASLAARYDFEKSFKRPAWRPSEPMLRPRLRVRAPETRHHVRGGCIDAAAPGLRRTPATAAAAPDDDASTPSITSASTSASSSEGVSPVSPAFLDQFCFFTGDLPRCTYSASTVEEYFSGASPRLERGGTVAG